MFIYIYTNMFIITKMFKIQNSINSKRNNLTEILLHCYQITTQITVQT